MQKNGMLEKSESVPNHRKYGDNLINKKGEYLFLGKYIAHVDTTPKRFAAFFNTR